MSSMPKLLKNENQDIQDSHLRDSVLLQLEWEPEINESTLR